MTKIQVKIILVHANVIVMFYVYRIEKGLLHLMHCIGETEILVNRKYILLIEIIKRYDFKAYRETIPRSLLPRAAENGCLSRRERYSTRDPRVDWLLCTPAPKE